MILTLRRSLLVFLVLLQMVAPLVHAHSDNSIVRFGFHLPNLEVYGSASGQITPTLTAPDYLSGLENAIVSISTGIENPEHDTDNLSPALYFPPDALSIAPTLSSCEINFSPQQPHLLKEFHRSPQSPRAPPYSI